MKQVNEVVGNGIHKIHIADREADIYELFFSAFEENTDLLIRAKHNRKTDEGYAVWDLISQQHPAGIVTLEVPDATGKKKQSVQAELRFQTVKIIRPLSSHEKYESVTMTAIEIKELQEDLDKDEKKLNKLRG